MNLADRLQILEARLVTDITRPAVFPLSGYGEAERDLRLLSEALRDFFQALKLDDAAREVPRVCDRAALYIGGDHE